MVQSIKEGIKGIGQFLGESTDKVIEGGIAFGDKIGVGADGASKFIMEALAPDTSKANAEFREKVYPTDKEVYPAEAPAGPEAEAPVPDKPQDEVTLNAMLTESSAPDMDVIRKVQKRAEEEPPYLTEDDTEDFFNQEDQDQNELLSTLEYMKAQVKGKGSGMVSKAGAVRKYHDGLKTWENPNKSGFSNGKFLPFKSLEGTGTDKDNSEYEIGYGIKIKQSWISDDRKNWPLIGGVKTDIRDGISEQTAERWCYEMQNKAYDSAKGKIHKPSWDKMAEPERTFWTDLVYNGGQDSIDANPKAKAAMDSGHTVEAMLKSLDYINASGKPMRGLLNRRLSMYNAAALDNPGVPVIESYELKGGEVTLKFASKFSSPKVSDKFRESLNSGGLKLKVKAGMREGKYDRMKDYSFRR